MRRLLIFLTIVSTVTACASSPPRAQRSEFEDIPVPNGLELDWSRSTVIESPTIKAARLFYKGRITPDSLALAFRSTPPQRQPRRAPPRCTTRRGVRFRS
jgi:hypothetical protein